ncbi:MAG: hypothetical protein JO133_05515 [Burkholderiaceae bacterium]|nr:hypothetical protein [Burkholderiaceae bacterium]
MKTPDSSPITWSLTRSGALVKAQARGHVFGGSWTESLLPASKTRAQLACSVTHCERCGAALFAESSVTDGADNPAVDADCPQFAAPLQ